MTRDGWLYKIFLAGPLYAHGLFSWAYLIITLIGVPLFIFLCFMFKRLSPERRTLTLKIVAFVLIGLELSRIVLQYGRYTFEAGEAVGGGVFDSNSNFTVGLGSLAGAISFTMCAFTVWLISFAILKNSAKVYKHLGTAIFVMGSCFSILACLLPYGFKPEDAGREINFQLIQTILTHYIIAFTPILLVIDGKIKPQFRAYGKFVALMAILTVIGYMASRLTGNNFMYTKDNTEIFFFLPYVSFPYSFPILLGMYSAGFFLAVGVYKLVIFIKGKVINRVKKPAPGQESGESGAAAIPAPAADAPQRE